MYKKSCRLGKGSACVHFASKLSGTLRTTNNATYLYRPRKCGPDTVQPNASSYHGVAAWKAPRVTTERSVSTQCMPGVDGAETPFPTVFMFLLALSLLGSLEVVLKWCTEVQQCWSGKSSKRVSQGTVTFHPTHMERGEEQEERTVELHSAPSSTLN